MILFFAAVGAGISTHAEEVLAVTMTNEASHPSAIVSDHRGRPALVVSVNGTRALVEENGRFVKRKGDAPLALKRVSSYAPGFVHIAGHHPREVIWQTQSLSGVRIGGEIGDGSRREYVLELLPDRDFKDCFVALVCYHSRFSFDRTREPDTTILLHEIGGLQAGRNVEVVIPARGRRGLGPFYYRLPIIFSAGREIRTNLAPQLATYCRQVELVRHKAVVAGHIAAHTEMDAPPRPIVRIQPVFPEDTDSATVPRRVNALFSVLPDGTVDKVVLPADLSPPVTWEIGRAFRAWLFLPMVRDGQPEGSSGALSVAIEASLPPSSVSE